MKYADTSLERWLAAALDSPLECGGAVAVVADGGASCAFAGLADGESRRAVRADTLFPVACLAKSVLATLAGVLIDAGRLSLGDRVHALLPRHFGGLHRISRSLELHHLLTHSSGLSGSMDFEDRDLHVTFGADNTDFLAIARPGDVYSYSSFGFVVLVGVIEAVTGTGWHEALTRYIGKPLQIRFGFGHSGASATGHAWDERGRALIRRKPPEPHQADRLHAAALDLHMTAADLARFAHVHLNDGVAPDGRRLLSRNLCKAMYTGACRPRFGSTPMLGLAWKHFAPGVCGHQGLTDGSRASLLLCRDRRKALLCLTNSGVSTLSQRLHAAHAFPKLVSEHVFSSGYSHADDGTSVTGWYLGGGRCASVERPRDTSAHGIVMRLHERDGTPFRNGCVPLARVGSTAYYVGKPRCARLPKGILVQFIRDADRAVAWVRVNGKALRKQPRGWRMADCGHRQYNQGKHSHQEEHDGRPISRHPALQRLRCPPEGGVRH